jgi:EmrB/QacA subfamily drug resistance transporter
MSEQPVGLHWGRLAAERARPTRIRDHPQAHWLVVGTVCIGAFMGQLDASIVTVSLPSLQRHFDVGVGAAGWVALSYLLVLVSGVVAIGRLSDMVGRKLVYIYGFALFTVASALCGLAPTLPALGGFRVLQALGAAMMQANSVALIARAMPPGRIARGLGVQGAAQAVGLALGPAVGGLLIGLGGWRLIFEINVPVGIAGGALGWFLLPRSRGLAPRAAFDWPALATLAAGTSGLLLALSFRRWAGLPVATVCLGAFVVRERRAPEPLLDLRLFRRGRFSTSVASGLLAYLAMFGPLTVLPFLLESAQHLSPAAAGLRLTALPVALALVAPLAGRSAERLGSRVLSCAGMLVTAAALAGLAALHGGDGTVMLWLLVCGAGLGLFVPVNNAAAIQSAPASQSALTGGVLNMTRGLGTALGVTVATIVLEGRAVEHGTTVALTVFAALAALAALIAAYSRRTQRKPTCDVDVSTVCG